MNKIKAFFENEKNDFLFGFKIGLFGFQLVVAIALIAVLLGFAPHYSLIDNISFFGVMELAAFTFGMLFGTGIYGMSQFRKEEEREQEERQQSLKDTQKQLDSVIAKVEQIIELQKEEQQQDKN
jgi:hypothetical protein